MLKTSKNVDFFVFVRKETPGKRSSMSAAVCAAAVAAVLVLWLFFTLLKMNTDNAAALHFAGDSGNNPAINSVNATPFTEITAIIENEKIPLTGAFEAIFASQPADLQILSVSYAYRVITLECTSERQLCGADFAALLRETGAFSHVRYDGVSRGEAGYMFTLAVTILEEGRAGRDEAD